MYRLTIWRFDMKNNKVKERKEIECYTLKDVVSIIELDEFHHSKPNLRVNYEIDKD